MGPMIQITETKCNECNGKGIDLKILIFVIYAKDLN